MGLRECVPCYNNYCCCCVTLKTGVLTIGILGAIFCGVNLALDFLNVFVNTVSDISNDDLEDSTGSIIGTMSIVLWVQVAISCLVLICTVLLIVAACKGSRRMLVPWMVVEMIQILLVLCSAVLNFVMGQFLYGGISLIIIGFAIHFWLVVFAYYEELRDGLIMDGQYNAEGKI